MNETNYNPQMKRRFRGYLPVVIDIETAGFDAEKNAVLEIAAVILKINDAGFISPAETIAYNVLPFAGAVLDPKALAFNGILEPESALRKAETETNALMALFRPIRAALKASDCKKAILTGHNAAFDLSFLKAAIRRCKIKRDPFHSFSTFDTVTLSGLAYQQTVLARAIAVADIEWDSSQAHTAVYDAEKTAELFCKIINQWQTYTDSAS